MSTLAVLDVWNLSYILQPASGGWWLLKSGIFGAPNMGFTVFPPLK